jgi:hypothetical protein
MDQRPPALCVPLVTTLTWLLYAIFSQFVFHPLAHIPGIKLAAITFFYQTYYSFVGGSHSYLQIAI